MSCREVSEEQLTTRQKIDCVGELLDKGYREVGVYDIPSAGEFNLQPCFADPNNPRSQVRWTLVICSD